MDLMPAKMAGIISRRCALILPAEFALAVSASVNCFSRMSKCQRHFRAMAETAASPSVAFADGKFSGLPPNGAKQKLFSDTAWERS
eukprot:1705694-Pyramimonas_sp.AAC.1